MKEKQVWIVWGGIFTDMSFETLEPGKEELHGPFHDEAAALRGWKAGTNRMMDIATHKLFVMLARPT